MTRKRKKGKGIEPIAPGDHSDTKHLPPYIRRQVLNWIGCYKTEAWIVQQLKELYNITRAAETIRTHYKANPDYKAQIQKYRDRFNDGLADEPVMSKRFMIQWLYEAAEEARAAKDYSGARALIKQIAEITGMKAPENVEINHTITGGATFESRLLAVQQLRQLPPADLDGSEPLSIPAVIDVQAD